MIESLRTWLLGVVFTAFAAGLATECIPKGRMQAMTRIAGGALMVLALLRPLGAVDWDKTILSVDAASLQTQQQTEIYRTEHEKELSSIIAERLETYIWDKATELGLTCTVRVRVLCGESGVPLPETVQISTAYDRALAVWLEEVVGIPAEKQIWLEESA